MDDNVNLQSRRAAGAVKTPGLVLLYILAFMMASGFTIQGFASVFHLSDVLGAGAGAVGRATGIQGLAYLAGCFLFPLLRRHEGLAQDFRILIFASPILAGLTVLFYFVPTVGGATIVLAGTGLATAFLWPPLMGVVSSLAEGSSLNRVMARYNLSWTLGPVLMPVIAGALYMRGSFFAFSAAGLMFVGGGAVYLFFFLFRRQYFANTAEADVKTAAPEGMPDAGIPGDSVDELLLNELTLREHRVSSWILLFSEHVVMGLLVFILPLSLRTDTGLNELSVGIVAFARSVFMMAGMWAFGHLDFWHFNRRSALQMSALYLLLLMAMYFFRSTTLVYIAVIALTGIPAAYFYSSGVFHGVAGSANRSRRMAVTEAVMTGGMFIGAALGGSLYQLRGMGAALSSAGGILLMGTVITYVIVRIIDISAQKETAE